MLSTEGPDREHAARVQRALAMVEDTVVTVADAAALVGPADPPAEPDADAYEVQQDADREQDDNRIIARHLVVPRHALGHLRRGMTRTPRTRLPRARRRGAGRPRARRSGTCHSGQDPGGSDPEAPAPPLGRSAASQSYRPAAVATVCARTLEWALATVDLAHPLALVVVDELEYLLRIALERGTP